MIISNDSPNVPHQLHFGGSNVADNYNKHNVIGSFFSSFYVDNFIYIIDRTRPPPWISEFLRIFLLAQIFLSGFLPAEREFWGKSGMINRMTDLIFVVLLVRPPKFENISFFIYFGIFCSLYIFFTIVTLGMRITFIYNRSFPYWLTVFAAYYMPIVDLLFYPPICACCGVYIGHEYANQTKSSGWFYWLFYCY